MAGVKAAPTLSKFHLPKTPAMPKVKPAVVKGPPPDRWKPVAPPKVPSVEPLSIQARHGEAPKLALAKAAAGASTVTSKRNPFYPTP